MYSRQTYVRESVTYDNMNLKYKFGDLNIKITDKTIKLNKDIQEKFAEWEELWAKCKNLSTIYFFLQLLV